MQVVSSTQVHFGDPVAAGVHIGRCEQMSPRERVQPRETYEREQVVQLELVGIPTEHLRHLEGTVVYQRIWLDDQHK